MQRQRGRGGRRSVGGGRAPWRVLLATAALTIRRRRPAAPRSGRGQRSGVLAGRECWSSPRTIQRTGAEAPSAESADGCRNAAATALARCGPLFGQCSSYRTLGESDILTKCPDHDSDTAEVTSWALGCDGRAGQGLRVCHAAHARRARASAAPRRALRECLARSAE